MPSLDQRLAEARGRLRDEIQQPELARIERRAAVLRRRRRVGLAATSLLVVVAAGTFVTQAWPAAKTAPPTTAASPSATPTSTGTPVTVQSRAGITLNGLRVGQPVVELPGDVVDLEFYTPDQGWALADSCPGPDCGLTLGTTEDGGVTWSVTPIKIDKTGGGNTDLIALGPQTLLLHWQDGQSQLSTDGGRSWTTYDHGPGDDNPKLDVNDRLVLRDRQGGSDCPAGSVELWRHTPGASGPTKRQPSIHACWISAVAAADGGWWVGGTTADGHAAAAVTHDAGQSWKSYEFPETGGWVQISTSGDRTYAAVVARDGAKVTLRGIYQQKDATFTRIWQGGGAAGPRYLAGELVPLLDGRLLLVDGEKHWYVSDESGTAFTELGEPEMPAVGRLVRVTSGYVAYDVKVAGYSARSTDGATWAKVQVK